MNTRTLIIKETQFFEILRKNGFERSQAFQNEIICLYEKQLNTLLKRPLSSDVLKGINNRATIISRKWKSMSGGSQQKKYLDQMQAKFIEIEFNQNDMVDNSNLIESYTSLLNENKELRSFKMKTDKKVQRIQEKLIQKHDDVKSNSINISRKRKSYADCSSENKKRIRAEVEANLKKVTAKHGLSISSVVLSSSSNADFSMKVLKDDPQECKLSSQLLLNVKDSCHLSDAKYSYIRKNCAPTWLSLHNIKKERHLMNTEFPVVRHLEGGYSSFSHKLNYIIQSNKEKFSSLDKISIKFVSDSTNIGKNLHVLNIAFCILNETEVCQTSKGHYVIAFYKIQKECYSEVKGCFELLRKEIQETKFVEIDGERKQIEYHVCCDWKMNAILLGLKAANSKNPCFVCKVDKEEFCKTDKVFSFRNVDYSARTVDESMSVVTAKTKDDFGYANEPILPEIPVDRFIVDMLHLLLRVFDALFKALVNDVITLDNVNLSPSSFDVNNYATLKKLETIIKVDCKVHFSFYVSHLSKKLEYKQLNGNEMKRVFSNIKVKEIIESHPKAALIDALWSSFYSIYSTVKENKSKNIYKDINKQTTEWLELYLRVYDRTTITPYMHFFVHHLHQYVHAYGDINQFTTQGIEKLNDLCTRYYFSGNNKKVAPISQLLMTRNREEIFNLRENAKTIKS